MNKIILLENESIRVEINEDVFEKLDTLDEWDVKEMFGYAENAKDAEEIEELINENSWEYIESMLSIYERDIWDAVSGLTYHEFIRLEEYSDLSLSEFEDVIDYYRYLLNMKKDYEIYNDLRWIFDNMDVIDLNGDDYTFDELDEDVQEEIKENERIDYINNWDDVGYWSEYYTEILESKHPIFKNLKVNEFDLNGCQGDFINLHGHIDINDLKILINDYGYSVFDAVEKWSSAPCWTKEIKERIINYILNADEDDFISIENVCERCVNATLNRPNEEEYDYLLEGMTESFVQYLMYTIQIDIESGARDNINDFIECEFEDYFNNIFIEDTIFDKHGNIK